ncbi:FAD-dependent oxidoreductase [Nonomuraea lactucae]|uniref:FAD-dependent oxidoreductase n=1 Tax=Nonomuraea lactucae TaxID=2249762 RepID=UPI000DE3BD4C|nr:FAD-dependent oxidoreductase [Nonomuraea lactucae]
MKVVVVGGGVAGAAGAIALRRIGADVTVYEAYEEPDGPVGSFLSLAGNGLRALDALGCLAPVREAGFTVARQRMWAGSGRLLGDVPRGRLSGDDLHSVTLMRADLVRVLRAEALRSGARVVTGERLAEADDTGDGVRVRLAGGRTADADLLVGADGIWSRTRTVLDPAAPVPAYAGTYHVSGVAEGPELEPGCFNMVFARGGAFICIPAPDGTVWWAAEVADPVQPDLAGVTVDGLAEIFRFERLPSAILAATTRTHRPTLGHILDEVPTWHADRIVLMGDAAHPVGAGQGASMALEDAVVLARELERSATTPAALTAYDRARRARVAKMAKAARDNRDAKTAGPAGRWISGLIMPVFFRFFYERATAWLYGYDLDWRPGTATEPSEPHRPHELQPHEPNRPHELQPREPNRPH